MKYYRFPDNKLVKICFPILLLALQVVARSTMYSSTLIGFNQSQMIMICLVALVGILFCAVNRKHLKQILCDRRMFLLVGSALVILVPMLVKRDFQQMYLAVLLCWLFAIFLTYFTDTRELGRWYVLIMTALSALSLVGLFVLKPLALAGVLPQIRFDSPGGWHMFNFGLTFVCDKNVHMTDALRAVGIFREPGMFQIFLFIAIHLNNYWAEWKKSWQMWAVDAVLFASLLTTFATGGVLALGLYVVFLFFDKGLYRDRRLQLLAGIAVVAGIGLLAYALAQGGTWAYELVGMVAKIFNQTESYTDRLDAVFADAAYFLANPLVGADLAEVLFSVSNNTATSPILFAVFGVVCGCVHVLSWVALAWKRNRHWAMNLLLMLILFVPFNTQNVIADMFFWMFPMMALSEQCLMLMDRIFPKKNVH